MGKYSYVYRGEVAPEDKGALWVHHEVFNDVSSPLVAEVYNGGSWSTLAGGSILEAIAAEEKKKEEEKKEEERKEYQELLKEPLTFEAKADDTKIYFLSYNATEQTRTIEVSTDDGKTWTEFTSEAYDEGNNTPVATLNMGQKALVLGNNPNGMGMGDDDFYSAGSFFIVGEAYVYGNIMSLLSKENFASTKEVPGYAFTSLFANYDDYAWSNDSSLFSHPSKKLLLPATILAQYCYSQMFNDCKSLTVAPELPATILVDNCYNNMFNNCTSLITAPDLPATTLASSCYAGMFSNCSNITTAPKLPATTLQECCYSEMFSRCFLLTNAPELPATTLADNCYQGMFERCTSLIAAPELPARILANNCYQKMFSNCTSITVAPKLPATTLSNGCYNSMFSGCTNLTVTPELPATILSDNCYASMFYDCSRLSFVKCAFTTTPGRAYTASWLSGVFPVGLILKKGPWTTTGDSGIPSGWTARSY